MLSYLIDDDEVDGKPALDYFIEDNKIESQKVLDDIRAAESVDTDVILFDIASKSRTSSAAQSAMSSQWCFSVLSMKSWAIPTSIPVWPI